MQVALEMNIYNLCSFNFRTIYICTLSQGRITRLTCQAIIFGITWPYVKELCGGCVAKQRRAYKVREHSTHGGARSVVLGSSPNRKRGGEDQHPPMHSADGGDSVGDDRSNSSSSKSFGEPQLPREVATTFCWWTQSVLSTGTKWKALM